VPDCDASDVTRHCNSLGYIDSQVLGAQHMLWNEKNSIPFDPEGLISTFGCMSTVFIGMIIGRIWSFTKSPLFDSTIIGIILIILGIVLVLVLHVPINKNVWSLSYNCILTGCNCFMLFAFNCCKEKFRWSKIILSPLEWLGSNALLFFVFSSCSGVLPALIRHFYFDEPSNNLYDWFLESVLQNQFGLEEAHAMIFFSIAEFMFWVVVCCILHKQKIFLTV